MLIHILIHLLYQPKYILYPVYYKFYMLYNHKDYSDFWNPALI